jgi:hypothetical protein
MKEETLSLKEFNVECKETLRENFMKTRIYFIIAVMTTAFLVGCMSLSKDIGVYDKSVSQERLCSLVLSPYLTVVKFDEKKVKWTAGIRFWRYKNAIIQIPEGYHSFIVDYHEENAAGTNWSYANGLNTNYTFEAGKTYNLSYKTIANRVSIIIAETAEEAEKTDD